jgi:ABC-type long-subunit fatty acid transport system fused permease/ATPase subunit
MQLLYNSIACTVNVQAIFYSIIENRIEASSEIYTQVASLVTLRLLAQTTNVDNLEAPKFKCLVGQWSILVELLRLFWCFFLGGGSPRDIVLGRLLQPNRD